MIEYQRELNLSVAEFVDCLVRSTLSERRPVDDSETMAGMIRNANVLITARTESGLLVGVSRAITDFHYCTYLSDLAVDVYFQGKHIGRELVERTHQEAGKHTLLVLLAAPKAESYYPHIGMQQHPSAWILPREPRPSGEESGRQS